MKYNYLLLYESNGVMTQQMKFVLTKLNFTVLPRQLTAIAYQCISPAEDDETGYLATLFPC